MGIAHLAFDLGLGHQRRNGVDDDHVNRVGAHQHVGDFQGLFASVRLRDQQVVNVDAQLAGVIRVQRVLGVDEGAGGALPLGFGDDRQGQGGLARGFRAVDFYDPTFRQAPDAKAISNPMEPVGIAGMVWRSWSPMRITAPLPNCFSIWPSAA